MRVSVKNLTIGVGSYLGCLAGGYYWALSKREEHKKEELAQLSEDAQGRPRRFTEAERLAVFGKGAAEYDKEIGTDETVMGLNLLRRWLLSKAEGSVLEVAGGTGRNFDYYPSRIKGLTVVDLSEGMIAETERKLRKRRRADVTFGVMDAARMSFPNRSFDTVVDTFGLCSFEDPTAALREMERVCRDGGRILLLEHGRAHYDWLNAILDKNSHRHTARWGCVWNRDVEALVREAGLEVKSLSRWHFGTTYVYVLGPGRRLGDRRLEEEEVQAAWGRWVGWLWGGGGGKGAAAAAAGTGRPAAAAAPS